jgi:hypothetical protein
MPSIADLPGPGTTLRATPVPCNGEKQSVENDERRHRRVHGTFGGRQAPRDDARRLSCRNAPEHRRGCLVGGSLPARAKIASHSVELRHFNSLITNRFLRQLSDPSAFIPRSQKQAHGVMAVTRS